MKDTFRVGDAVGKYLGIVELERSPFQAEFSGQRFYSGRVASSKNWVESSFG